MKKPKPDLFPEVNSDKRKRFLIRLRIENINRIRIASIFGLAMAVGLLFLDITRYYEGRFSENIYALLFVNHLAIFLLAVPLVIIYLNQETVAIGRYKHSYFLITSWTVFVSLVTLTMAILSMLERGSIAMYAINIVVVNFVVILLHKHRVLLNILSFCIIVTAILIIQKNNVEMVLANLLEASGVTVLAFVISTNLFNHTLKDFNHERNLEAKNDAIEKEKARSHELLLNILPAKVATELIIHKKVQPRDYSSATVMMIDFKEFSKKSVSITPTELVNKIDYCFSNFDQILPKYGLEKIKTLGDGYLCVGGVPTPTTDHPEQVILAALEILEFLEKWKTECMANNEIYFEGRVGIHTGPLIAGVVGKTKFAFDIWGDTVNISARLETNGEAGRVNISRSTYQLVQNRFECTHRGKIPIKNQEPIDMYFIEKIK